MKFFLLMQRLTCPIRRFSGFTGEKSLGRYTVPGSFLSGHTPLFDTQARTRSWLSELQNSQLVILSLVDKKDVRNEELMEQ